MGETNQKLWIGARKIGPAICDLSAVYNVFYDFQEELNASAGTNALDSVSMSSSVYTVITNICATNLNNVCTLINIFAYNGVSYYRLKSGIPTIANESVDWQGKIILEATDKIRVNFYGCVLYDDLNLEVCGYKVYLD